MRKRNLLLDLAIQNNADQVIIDSLTAIVERMPPISERGWRQKRRNTCVTLFALNDRKLKRGKISEDEWKENNNNLEQKYKETYEYKEQSTGGAESVLSMEA